MSFLHVCLLQSLAHWRGVDVVAMIRRIKRMSDEELTAERMAYVAARLAARRARSWRASEKCVVHVCPKSAGLCFTC